MNAVRAARNVTNQVQPPTTTQKSILEFLDIEEGVDLNTSRNVTATEDFATEEFFSNSPRVTAIEESVPPPTQQSILDFFSAVGADTS